MRNEQGAALLEVVTGLAIAGLVLSVMATATFRVAQGFDYSNAQVLANSSFQNALSFLAADLQMARYTSLTEGVAASSVTLTWTDYYNGGQTGHTATYALSGTDLQRTYAGTTGTVARNVSAVSFTKNSRQVTVELSVTTSSGPRSYSDVKTFRLQMRPGL